MSAPRPEQVRQDLNRMKDIIVGLTGSNLPPHTLSELVKIRTTFKRLALAYGIDLLGEDGPDPREAQWKALADKGDYIAAIKLYREIADCAIFTAKDVVEQYIGRKLR
jgi:hypothetical protein